VRNHSRSRNTFGLKTFVVMAIDIVLHFFFLHVFLVSFVCSFPVLVPPLRRCPAPPLLHKAKTRAMNIPSTSSGHRPPESVDWAGSDPPKLPKHWSYLLPLSMTHEVDLWGTSLLALLVKELVLQYSAPSDPSAHDIVSITEQATKKGFVASTVQQLAGMETTPDKSLATTCIRNFFAFVFEEYGFGGARAWARHLFEARIKDLCKDRKKRKGK
jgi:hypothetical protein